MLELGKRIIRAALVVAAAALVWGLQTSEAHAARIKDIAYVQGVRENQLLGYGLVVGLAGTGDTGQSEFTVQSTASMLSRMGIKVDKDRIQTRNVAAVMVTAELPPFSRSGQRLDVVVSSLGNARSLQGGTLLMTPLTGPDGNIYAVAQGALSLGGYEVQGGAGTSQVKNHVTAGRVPQGALIERELGVDLSTRTEIRLVLREPDFTTAMAVARAVNELFPEAPAAAAPAEGAAPDAAPAAPPASGPQPSAGIATALDSSTVRIEVPAAFQSAVPQFIATVEVLQVATSRTARVVVNERTGTVVLGGDVRISQVAVAHGGLTVRVSSQNEASQPNPLGTGDTQTVTNTDVQVSEQPGYLSVIDGGASIGDVVAALNAIGATPRDLIAILQAIKSAGALEAQLVIQ